MKKLLTLFTLLLTVCSGAWAEDVFTELRTVDFTSLGEYTSFSTTAKENHVTETGYTDIVFYTTNANKTMKINPTAGVGVDFAGQNYGGSQFIAIPLTGVNGKIKVTFHHQYSSGKAKFKIAYSDNATSYVTSPPSGTDVTDVANADTQCSWTSVTLEHTNGYLYIGEAGTSYTYLKKVVVETLAAAGVTNPSFSVAAGSSIVKNTTSAVTLTSAGNTIYYMWNASDAAYTTGAALAAAAEGNNSYGPSSVAVTAPNATGATYLYAVAKDGEGKYSDVVKRSYTITNPSYTVTLNTNGGTINAGNVTEYVEGTGATLPTNVTKDCYTFAGWYANSELTGDEVITISTDATGNKEYWAKWTPKYATSLDFQSIVEAGTQEDNPIATLLADANMEHSTFTSSVWETGKTPSPEYVGFKLKDDGAYVKFLVKAGKEVTITLGNIAQTLELYKNGVKTNIAASTGAGVQTVVPAFTPAEDMLVELRTTNTGTVTLKKIIIDEPIAKFDVTYKANGSGEADVLNNVSKVDENMFTYAGHAFTGWNTKADGNGDDYAVGDDVTSELTLFAQWISTYTVEFDLQSHGSAIDAQEVAEGGKAVEPTAPTADGWVFGGWYEESTCENEFDFNTTINADKTLYAKWTEDVKVSAFSLSFVNTSDYKMSQGDNNDLTESEVSVTGGSASIRFWNNKTDVTVLETSSKKIYYSTGNMNLKLVLNTPLKVGDVISFAGGEGNQIAITDTDESPNSSSNKEVTTSYSYTVKADDHLVGKSIIYVGRGGTSSTRHGAITITSAAANVTVSNLGIEGEKDYATMYYGTVAMAVPAGVKAKTYKIVDGKLTVSRTYENGGTYDVIPAGEAVVLEADVDANTPYMFSVSSTTTEPDGENLLRGTDAAQTINAAGYKYYKLAKNNAGTKVGFYYAVEDGVSITNGAHKAYLAVPTGSGEAKEYFVLGGEDETSSEATAISAVEIEIANGATLYNLAGQKVGKDYKGIIVVNGKKYVRK